MDRIRLKLSYFSLHAIASVIARPDLMWRIIISATVLLAALISVISFISYAWATHAAPAVMPAITNRDAFTREDIRRTLDSYNAKDVKFRELQSAPPEAPRLSGGTGKEVDASTISTLESNDTPAKPVLDGPLP